MVWPLDPDREYDPSRRSNMLVESMFSTLLDIELDVNDDDYAEKLITCYELLDTNKLNGLAGRIKVGYKGLHARYNKADKPFYTLSKGNGEPMKGYEDKQFDSPGAVELELNNLNESREPGKKFQFNKFPEILAFMEPKESNSHLTSKLFKKDTQVDGSDEDTF